MNLKTTKAQLINLVDNLIFQGVWTVMESGRLLSDYNKDRTSAWRWDRSWAYQLESQSAFKILRQSLDARDFHNSKDPEDPHTVIGKARFKVKLQREMYARMAARRAAPAEEALPKAA